MELWLIAGLGSITVALALVPSGALRRRGDVSRTLAWLADNRMAAYDSRAGPARPAWTQAPPLPALVRMLAPLVKAAYRERLTRYLAQTQTPYTWEDILAMKLLFAGIAAGYFAAMWVFSGSEAMIPLLLASPAIAWCVPDRRLIGRLQRRQAAIRKELPAVLGALAVTTEAGLSLPAALAEAGGTWPGVLGSELTLAAEQIALGSGQGEALQALSDRCQVAELTLFIGTMLQCLAKGDQNVVEVIRQQAEEAWTRRRRKAEALAQQASIKLFLPLLLLVFPAMVIFLLSPALLSVIRFFLSQ